MRVKKIAAVLTGIITFFSGIASISAADVDDIAKADSPLFSIMLSYTSSTITNFRISNGTGIGLASVDGYEGKVTQIKIYSYIQRYANSNNGWVNYDNWIDSTTNYYLDVSHTSSLMKGYDYRFKAVYYVYSGNDYERLIDYGPTLHY